VKPIRIVVFLVCACVIVAAAFSAQQPVSDQAAPPAPAAQTPGAAPPQGNGQQPTPIRVSTQLVHLVVTVTDKKRDFVTDLEQSDFKILENGQPQDIRFFGRETDLPLRIGVLLDTSNSIRPRLQFEQAAAIDFLNRVIRPLKDQAFLMTFDNEPQIIQDYTDDLGALNDAIRDQRAGGGTALNDAIYLASQKLGKAPLPSGPDEDVRKVVVVLSDGDDNLSDHAPSDAVDAIIRGEAAVYSISTNTDWIAMDNPDQPKKYSYTPGDKILQNFSDQTGGRAFYPYKVEDLGESFTQIGTELRSQYFIAYFPSAPPDGKYRKIDVNIDRKNLIVRTRKGYYAEAEKRH
jgi:Ca-activated chloride channel family protein